MRRNYWLACFVLCLTAKLAWAELPSIRFDRITPIGANVGTSVDVEILGNDIEEVKALLFDQPGLTAVPVEGKERQFKVSIAADVPEGTYDVRLVGRFGVSNPRLFGVTHGLTDVTEKEPNNDAATAQPISLNAAVNASSDGNDQDVFRVPLTKGQRVLIDCLAGRLDSPLDSTVSLANAEGRILISNGDYFGRDSFLDFVAPADGEYLIIVHDLSYRGGFPYRLLVTNRPQVENVFPRVVQLGQSADLLVLGRNLPNGKATALTQADLPLEEVRLALPAPTDGSLLGSYSFIEHPTAHTVSPTAATCTLNGFQFRPNMSGTAALNAVPMMLTDSPVTLEAEPNDSRDTPQKLTLPVVVSGRFDRPRDVDWYEIEVAEAGAFYVEVFCERIAGQADPYVVLIDDQGNRVGEFDDFGHRINAFDGHLRDPVGTFNLAANKKYRLLVQDRYQRGGPRYQYVLTFRKPQPDFFVAAIHSRNPEPAGWNLRQGGATHGDLIIHQRDGFTDAVTITTENIPPGVHFAPTSVFQNNHGTFVLWCDDNAPEVITHFKLIATGKRGDEVLRREVRPVTRLSNDGGINSSRAVRQLALSVREKAPFALRFEPDRLQVEAGKKVEAKLRLTRLWPEFKNNVTIQPLAFPGNINFTGAEFSGDATEVTVSFNVQNGTRTGDFTLAILGQGQVPYNKNPQEQNRPNTLVSLPSQPITISVTQPPK